GCPHRAGESAGFASGPRRLRRESVHVSRHHLPRTEPRESGVDPRSVPRDPPSGHGQFRPGGYAAEAPVALGVAAGGSGGPTCEPRRLFVRAGGLRDGVLAHVPRCGTLRLHGRAERHHARVPGAVVDLHAGLPGAPAAQAHERDARARQWTAHRGGGSGDRRPRAAPRRALRRARRARHRIRPGQPVDLRAHFPVQRSQPARARPGYLSWTGLAGARGHAGARGCGVLARRQQRGLRCRSPDCHGSMGRGAPIATTATMNPVTQPRPHCRSSRRTNARPSSRVGRPGRTRALLVLLVPLVCLLVLPGCRTPGGPKPGRTKLSSPLVELPATVIGNLLIVEAQWDRSGPWRFLIDTGSSVTLVSPEFADRYRTKEAARHAPAVRVRDAAGAETMLEPVTIRRIQLGDARFDRVQCLVYDPAELSAHLGMKIDGILGFPLFRETIMTMDYPQSRLI